jgi:hypothetical protein
MNESEQIKGKIDTYKAELLASKLNEEDLTIKVTVLNKAYWKNNDIMIIMDCGKTKASKYRSQIDEHIKKQNKELPYQIPSKLAIKVLGIDEKGIREAFNYIREVKHGTHQSKQHYRISTSQAI